MSTAELTKKEILLESLSELDFSGEPPFAQNLRAEAKKALTQLEFPTTKTEYWKYTRIGKIINNNYAVTTNKLARKIDIADYLIPELDAHVVVVVNGFYCDELSKIEIQKGFKIHS